MSLTAFNTALEGKKLNDEDKLLLKNTVCRNGTDNELEMFLYVCKHTGLNPFLKQIYAIKRGQTMTIQTSIDGLRAIAERTRRYAPGSAPQYNYSSSNNLVSATAYVMKMTQDGKWHQVSATAFYAEYCQEYNGKPSQFWSKMPHLMLAKCAEALALRRAFPYEMGSLYISEEMHNGVNKSDNPDEFLTEESIGIAPEDIVDVEIPEGVKEEDFLEYLSYLCESFKKPIPLMRKEINARPQPFWDSFYKWLKKKTTSETEEESPETQESDQS